MEQEQAAPQEAGYQYKEKEKERIADSAATLADSTKALVKFGGFSLLEKAIKGVSNLNPDSKARKKIFLTDMTKKAEREQLKNTLNQWYDLLSENANIAEAVNKAQEKAEGASRTYKVNLKKAVEASKELESNYRSLHLFMKNSNSEKIKNLTIVNADLEQVKDFDNPVFYDAISDEISKYYDRLDLRDNYSLLVIPGYLGSNQAVEKWAKLAYKNKMMLVTDFENLESADAILEFFNSANLTSGDIFKKNAMVACNHLVGRGKEDSIGEEEDVFVSPASALAGKMYGDNIAQVTAGKKFGTLSEVSGVRLNLRKSELTNMEKIGMIPMVNEFGKVMSMSAKTLYSGDNLGHQTYSVVRVFDYVMKVLIHFLNQRAFENFSGDMKKEVRAQIEKFLDGIKGHGKLIEDFTILRFERDPNQKDRVFLDIHMKPYFPGKSYVINLEGQDGEDPDKGKWGGDISQQ